jgi:hypothetical protein
MTTNAVRLTENEAITYKNLIPDYILARHCPLNDGRQATNVDFQSAPTLGALDALPVELKQLAVKELDVQSLLAFRLAKKRAMDLVGSLVEWQKVRPRPRKDDMNIGRETADNHTDKQTAP